MNPTIKHLLTQAQQLCVEINEETEMLAMYDLASMTVVIRIKPRKDQYTENHLYYSGILLLDEDIEDKTQEDLEAFKTFALNLIKEQNPPTYQRIKQQFNA